MQQLENIVLSQFEKGNYRRWITGSILGGGVVLVLFILNVSISREEEFSSYLTGILIVAVLYTVYDFLLYRNHISKAHRGCFTIDANGKLYLDNNPISIDTVELIKMRDLYIYKDDELYFIRIKSIEGEEYVLSSMNIHPSVKNLFLEKCEVDVIVNQSIFPTI